MLTTLFQNNRVIVCHAKMEECASLMETHLFVNALRGT